MRPVDETAQVVPLIKAPEVNAVADANRDAIRQFDVVCQEQRAPTGDLDDNALVREATRLVV